MKKTTELTNSEKPIEIVEIHEIHVYSYVGRCISAYGFPLMEMKKFIYIFSFYGDVHVKKKL